MDRISIKTVDGSGKGVCRVRNPVKTRHGCRCFVAWTEYAGKSRRLQRFRRLPSLCAYRHVRFHPALNCTIFTNFYIYGFRIRQSITLSEIVLGFAILFDLHLYRSSIFFVFFFFFIKYFRNTFRNKRPRLKKIFFICVWLSLIDLSIFFNLISLMSSIIN